MPRLHHAPLFHHGPRALTAMSAVPIIVQRDTCVWQLQVWISSSVVVFLCAAGLAKMLRDRHEADLLEARLQGRREVAQAASAPTE